MKDAKSDGAEVRAFQVGDRVRMNRKPEHDRQYVEEAQANRRALSGRTGVITQRSNMHGETFMVSHDGGAGSAWWEPDELVLLPKQMTDAEIANVLRLEEEWRGAELSWWARQAVRMARELQALRARLPETHGMLATASRNGSKLATDLEQERQARIEAERRESEARADREHVERERDEIYRELEEVRQKRDRALRDVGERIIERDEARSQLAHERAEHQATREQPVMRENERLRARLAAFTAPSAGLDRESLGRMVRDIWIEWAREQPAPKPSWLVPWEGLNEPDREVDRRIGERLAAAGRMGAEQKLSRLVSLAQALFAAQRGDRSIGAYEASEALRAYVEAIAGDVPPMLTEERAEAIATDAVVRWQQGGEVRAPLGALVRRVALALRRVDRGDRERIYIPASETHKPDACPPCSAILGGEVPCAITHDFGPGAYESKRVNRSAYEKLVTEDIEWLERQPRTLERDHVIAIVRASVDHEYGPARGETEPR